MVMSNKDYRSAEGISKSQLFKLTKSPLHFKYALDHPQEETPSLLFGRACHKYILEKDDFEKEYAVAPLVDKRTKAGKELWQQFVDSNQGKEIITQDMYEQILEMSSAIDRTEGARELLTGQCEQSFFWTDERTGEKCKCRPDCMTETKTGAKLIVDYKTTESCEDGHFERACKKYGYQLQAGMYCEGVFNNLFEEYGFAFVAQEKTAPYAVRIYMCSPEYILQGYDQFRELIGLYHECKQNDKWPGYEYSVGAITDLLADDYM